MAREILRGLGAEFAYMFSWPRKRDKQQKPEFPLDPAEITRLEEENEQILEKEDFERKDFGVFCKNTTILARQKGDVVVGLAVLHDTEGRVMLDINEDMISVRVYPEPTENISELGGSVNQYVTYSPQHIDNKGFYSKSIIDFKPILTTHARVPVPNTSEFFSFFSGKSELAFHNGRTRVDREEIVSDKDVQAFCKRVYSVYNLNKAELNSAPQ